MPKGKKTPKSADTPEGYEVAQPVMLDLVSMVALVAAPIYGVLRYAGQPDLSPERIRRQCIVDAMSLLGQAEAELPTIDGLIQKNGGRNVSMKELHEAFEGPDPKREKPYVGSQEEPARASEPGEPEATDSPQSEGG
jgi:hypothetical protein